MNTSASIAAACARTRSYTCRLAPFWPLTAGQLCVHARSQSLHAGDLVLWDKNGNGYYIMPKNRWYVESGRYDEKNAGGGLGQWDRDHHYDVWGKVCARGFRAAGCVMRINMQLVISS